jgi:hypothetical protein
VKFVGAGGAATTADGELDAGCVASGADVLTLDPHAASSSATTASPAIDVRECLICRTSCSERRHCATTDAASLPYRAAAL